MILQSAVAYILDFRKCVLFIVMVWKSYELELASSHKLRLIQIVGEMLSLNATILSHTSSQSYENIDAIMPVDRCIGCIARKSDKLNLEFDWIQ